MTYVINHTMDEQEYDVKVSQIEDSNLLYFKSDEKTDFDSENNQSGVPPTTRFNLFSLGDLRQNELRSPSDFSVCSSEEMVPVAVPAEGNENILMEDEIIEGVVVRPVNRPPKKRYLEWVLALATIIILVIVAIMVVERKKPQQKVIIDQVQPTPSPSIKENLNTSLESFLKELILPISGEEVLNDPTSLQYNLWKFLSMRLPGLIDRNVLSLNNTNEILERYAATVVTLSLSGSRFGWTSEIDHSIVFPKNCEIFQCNEKNEIMMIQSKNTQSDVGGGIIANEIGHLKGLTDIILPRNALRGTIPTKMGMLSNLENLDLTSNKLTGTIPTEFGKLKSLGLLFLDSNLLQSSIPSELGNMSQIAYMGLSKNKFTGNIPTALDNLENLQGVNLHGNNFNGSVDFLCDNNIPRNGSISKTVTSPIVVGLYAGLEGAHTYFGKFGIEVDCIGDETVPMCSCCICSN